MLVPLACFCVKIPFLSLLNCSFLEFLVWEKIFWTRKYNIFLHVVPKFSPIFNFQTISDQLPYSIVYFHQKTAINRPKMGKCLHCKKAHYCHRHKKIVRLLHRDELPRSMWMNEHIHTGYRPTNLSFGVCVRRLVCLWVVDWFLWFFFGF
jgi:hypothetical protein